MTSHVSRVERTSFTCNTVEILLLRTTSLGASHWQIGLDFGRQRSVSVRDHLRVARPYLVPSQPQGPEMSHSKTSRCRPAHRIGRHAARYLPSHRRAHKAQAAGVVRLKIESNNRYDEQIHGSDLRQVIGRKVLHFDTSSKWTNRKR
jgi:hypothetical protein